MVPQQDVKSLQNDIRKIFDAKIEGIFNIANVLLKDFLRFDILDRKVKIFPAGDGLQYSLQLG
uniref:Uncharacterized protein n=1 Tax=Romanomermis culicivorax TaxID=13658 RepID=A0A915IS47_ROMCU